MFRYGSVNLIASREPWDHEWRQSQNFLTRVSKNGGSNFIFIDWVPHFADSIFPLCKYMMGVNIKPWCPEHLGNVHLSINFRVFDQIKCLDISVYNNVHETKCGQIKFNYWSASAEVLAKYDTKGVGIFELHFDNTNKIITLKSIWI